MGDVVSRILREDCFTLELVGDQVFGGFTNGEQWNGWACPYFTFDVGQQIVQSLGKNQVAFYDEASNEFVFDVNGTNDPTDYDRFGSIEAEGIGKLYPIGTHAWIWEEVAVENGRARVYSRMKG